MGKKPSKKGGPKPPIHKSRKELRKEQRKEKKLKRAMRFQSKIKSSADIPSDRSGGVTGKLSKNGTLHPPPKVSDDIEEMRKKEKLKQKKLQSEMRQSRKKQLLAANEDEDRNIKHLEKLLRLNRHKGGKKKSLPKSFADDGLGYLLEVCDPDVMKETVKVDQALQDSGSEFEEDYAIVRGKEKRKKERGKSLKKDDGMGDTEDDAGSSESGNDCDNNSDGSENEDDSQGENLMDDEPMSDTEYQVMDGDEDVSDGDTMDQHDDASDADDDEVVDDTESENCTDDEIIPGDDESEDESSSPSPHLLMRSKKEVSKQDNNTEQRSKEKGKVKSSPDLQTLSKGSSLKSSKPILNEAIQDNISSKHNDVEAMEGSDDEDKVSSEKNESLKSSDGMWEDIYGRTRGKDGHVVDSKSGKYIPPALRAKLQGDNDTKRKETLARLRRQMKGLLNRLAENNMASICSQMDELFMKNSRNDMNETLLSLFNDSLISHILTPERLVMEHMLLIAVLHANVGSEVGAHFLQNMMKKFQDLLASSPEVEDKEIDNVVLILSHLYNFKVFAASLMYEVLDKISVELNEKRIELLLVVLRSVGFSLRKDDPLALKSLILKLQSKAVNFPSASSTSSRVKFMLDTLMAIKNNNVSKIPSYDPEHVEHLRKLLRSLLRRGNYVAELKISLDDLLKADERGRWWIVGSAWTGHLPGENPTSTLNPSAVNSSKSPKSSEASYSSQLLELARKQRMNTGVRKDVFCILMTAEDYLDAFEKLLHLNLKNQQRQEIVHVLFDCCLQEKSFNPFYAHLAQKFCDIDRQYQMKFQYCLWDKLKELDKLKSTQLGNMAKFLAHLFLEKGLPISALKVVSFAEMEKHCVRLVRQILLIILLTDNVSQCEAVFLRIAMSPQLHLFREGLRLFISHFVLRQGKSKALPKQDLILLHDRAKIVAKALSSADPRTEF